MLGFVVKQSQSVACKWVKATFVLALWLCSLPAVAAPIATLPDKVRFKHVIPQESDFVGEVLVIHQDRYGFIWVGGKNGLGRFDGYDYKIYRQDPANRRSLSDNVVNDIVEDDDGNLWIGTNGGLNYFDREKQIFTHYKSVEGDSTTLSSNRVVALFKEGNHTLWIGGDRGLHQLNLKTKVLTRLPTPSNSQSEMKLIGEYVMGIHVDSDTNTVYLATGYGLKIWNRTKREVRVLGDPLPKGMPSRMVRSVFVDSQKRVWVGTESGLAQYKEADNSFTFYPTKSDVHKGKSTSVWQIKEDRFGDIWAASDGNGVLRLKRDSDALINYRANNRDPFSAQRNVVRAVIEDKSGDIWLGFFPGGVDTISRYNATFTTHQNISDDNTSINDNGVASLFEDGRGTLWVGTDGGGVNKYDAVTNTYSYIEHDPNNERSIGSDAIMFMAEHKGGLWLALYNGGVSRVDLSNFNVTRYNYVSQSPTHLQSPHIFSLFSDSRGILWAGSMGGGLARYNEDDDVFEPIEYDPVKGSIGNERIWSIDEDRNGILWMGTHDGLVKYDVVNNQSWRFRYDVKNTAGISNAWVTAVVEDSRGNIWAGTHGGGLNLFHPESQTFTHVQENDGLSSNIIYALLEDEQGLIWMSTNKGLISYNPLNQKILNFSADNGLQGNQFIYGSATAFKNGDLAFGGANGYTRFNPKMLTPNAESPPVVFTGITVQEKTLEIGNTRVLDKDILTAEEIVLNYDQNVFSINYAALNYRITEDNQYAYKLEGFDERWQYAGSKHVKSYTNLNPGKYTFRVKASNNEGVWNETGAEIQLKVIPPPWRTWWAYGVYVFSLVSLIGWYIRSQKKIAVQGSLVAHLQQVDKLKDEFIASTSHELRTPLFGIVGLAETVLKEAASYLKARDKNNIDMIIASGRRLVTQVNDILDYAKIKNNALEVNLRPLNIFGLLELVLPLTEQIVGKKQLKIINAIDENLPAVLADPHRLQQVLINLIANAVHHTSEGTVTLSARKVDGHIQVNVSDTGKGIPKEKFDELFEQFTQLDNVNSREQKGTGLGLPITKKLIELQNGKIWVESKIDEGSTFSFTLPITHEQAEDVSLSAREKNRLTVLSERNQSKSSNKIQHQQELAELEELPIAHEQNQETAHILIVDDEKVNRMVLSAYLKDNPYTISEAESGDHALDLLENDASINIVLLDVMMPGLSGFDTCKLMRKHHSGDTLTIIFTTAKGNCDEMDYAFHIGGDDFLNKPVDKNELNARVSMYARKMKRSAEGL